MFCGWVDLWVWLAWLIAYGNYNTCNSKGKGRSKAKKAKRVVVNVEETTRRRVERRKEGRKEGERRRRRRRRESIDSGLFFIFIIN